MKTLYSVLAALLLTVIAIPAFATPPPPPSTVTPDNMVSAFGLLAWNNAGLGLGARYQRVIVPQGFLHLDNSTIHDQLAIEGGLDYIHFGVSNSFGGFSSSVDVNYFRPVVGCMWDIFITDKFIVYPKLDISYEIASVSYTVNGQSAGSFGTGYGGFLIEGAAGAMYMITPQVALRGEIGSGFLKIGGGFQF